MGSDLLWLLNLRRIDIIVPMLVVADRHLRFPGRGAWFQYHRDQVLGPWARIDFLVLCGTEDVETLEHMALTGGGTVMDSVARYTPSR